MLSVLLPDEVHIANAIVSANFEGLPCKMYLGLEIHLFCQAQSLQQSANEYSNHVLLMRLVLCRSAV